MTMESLKLSKFVMSSKMKKYKLPNARSRDRHKSRRKRIRRLKRKQRKWQLSCMVIMSNMMNTMTLELNMKMTSFKLDVSITCKNRSNEIKIQTSTKLD